MTDRDEKRRQAFGERSGGAKLTSAAVIEIRARIADGALLTDVAAAFGVAPTIISGVAMGKYWKSVPGALAPEDRIPHQVRGEGHGRSKLTVQQVIEIRRRRSEGVRYDNLAVEFGVSPSAIGLIVRRKNWSHVE